MTTTLPHGPINSMSVIPQASHSVLVSAQANSIPTRHNDGCFLLYLDTWAAEMGIIGLQDCHALTANLISIADVCADYSL